MSRTTQNWLFPACVLVLGLLLAPTLATAYGGGGGEGAGFDAMMGIKDAPEPWTSTDLEGLFESTTPEDRAQLVRVFTGTTISKRELISVRQIFLTRRSEQLARRASFIDFLTKTVEALDTAGQWAQTGLTFVPGVGWVTSAGLSAARAGADAYKGGKSGTEIVQDMVVNGAASAVVGKFSPLNADKSFSTARAGINLARGTTSTAIRNRAAKVAVKGLGRFTGKKLSESYTEKGISAALGEVSNFMGAQNNATPPSYNPTPGYTFDPNMSAPATPVSGSTVDIF